MRVDWKAQVIEVVEKKLIYWTVGGGQKSAYSAIIHNPKYTNLTQRRELIIPMIFNDRFSVVTRL